MPIPDEARLSLPADKKSGNPDILKNLDKPNNTFNNTQVDNNVSEHKDETREIMKEPGTIGHEGNVALEEGNPNSQSNGIESVIEKQKRIEEENKRKKEVIRKALEDR